MTQRALTIKPRDKALLAWIAAFPFLVAWPVLSSLPLFSLLGGSASWLAFSVQAAFLATGFWAVLAVYLALKVLAGGNDLSVLRPSRALMLAHVVAWTVAYGVYSLWPAAG